MSKFNVRLILFSYLVVAQFSLNPHSVFRSLKVEVNLNVSIVLRDALPAACLHQSQQAFFLLSRIHKQHCCDLFLKITVCLTNKNSSSLILSPPLSLFPSRLRFSVSLFALQAGLFMLCRMFIIRHWCLRGLLILSMKECIVAFNASNPEKRKENKKNIQPWWKTLF